MHQILNRGAGGGSCWLGLLVVANALLHLHQSNVVVHTLNNLSGQGRCCCVYSGGQRLRRVCCLACCGGPLQ